MSIIAEGWMKEANELRAERDALREQMVKMRAILAAAPSPSAGEARSAALEEDDPAELMDDFIRAVLAGNNPRSDEPYKTVAAYLRKLMARRNADDQIATSLADALRNMIATATDKGHFVSREMIEAREKAGKALDLYLDRHRARALTGLSSARQAADALEWLESNCCDLRCVDVPTGGGDADIGWEIIEHHLAKPTERRIGFGMTPLEAIAEARAALQPSPPSSGEQK